MSKTLLIEESSGNNFRLASAMSYGYDNKIIDEHALIYEHCHIGSLVFMDNDNWSKCIILLKMHGFDYVLIDADIDIFQCVLIVEEE